MPFARPTLLELRELALQDVYAVLGVKGLLRFAVLRVLTWVVAGLAHLHYGYLDWIARQSTPFTATEEWLEAWAALVGILRKAASYAGGSVAVTGPPGTLIAAGLMVRRAGDAAGFAVLQDVTIPSGGVAMVGVQALDAGAAGNTAVDVGMAFASPVSGLTDVRVGTAISGGADPELDDALRTRMLRQWAAPPQGGDEDDYVEWALAVPGVTRAWVISCGAGPGTVVVYTMWDLAESGAGGFPQGTDGVATGDTRDVTATGDQLIVADQIRVTQPVTALVHCVAPQAYPVAFSIHSTTPVPSTVQAAVAAAIDAVFLAVATPKAIEIEASLFQAALAAVPGMPAFTMTAPGAINAPVGSLPVRGAVTYG